MRGPLDFDLEDEGERWQDLGRRLGRLGGWTGWLIVLVIVGLWLASGIYTVGPSEVGLVKRFGKFTRQVGPGLHYRLPSPIESVVIVNQYGKQEVEIGVTPPGRFVRAAPAEESLMLTGDFNIVYVEATIAYNVSRDPQAYAFEIEDPQLIVRQAAQAIIREQVALQEVDRLFASEERQLMGERIKQELQALLDRYGTGIQVLNVFLQEVKPPTPEVAAAFDDVNSAIQDKERMILEAQRYANEQIPRAEGQAQKILNEAEAYKQSRILEAQGAAARFLSVLESYYLGETVTAARLYIETMEEILPGMRKVILPTGGSGLVSLLDLERLLQGRSPMREGGEGR